MAATYKNTIQGPTTQLQTAMSNWLLIFSFSAFHLLFFPGYFRLFSISLLWVPSMKHIMRNISSLMKALKQELKKKMCGPQMG